MSRARKVKLLIGITVFAVVVAIVCSMVKHSRLRHEMDQWVHGFSLRMEWTTNVPYEAALALQKGECAKLSAEAVDYLIDDLKRQPGAFERFHKFITRFKPFHNWNGPTAESWRFEAAEALSLMGVRAAPAISQLTDNATNDSWRVQQAAIRALGDIGVADPMAVRALQSLTNSSSWSAVAAAVSLWQLNPTNSAYIDLVNAQLGSGMVFKLAPGGLKFWLSDRLSRMGTNALVFVPGLRSITTGIGPNVSGMPALGNPRYAVALEVGARAGAADALWRLEGSVQPALQAFSSFTNSAAIGKLSQRDYDAGLCWITQSMSVAELRDAIHPLVEAQRKIVAQSNRSTN